MMNDEQQRTSITDGKVNSLSVTSISKFDPEQPGGCYRKGHYHYVQGKEEPEGKAALRGQETHAQIPKAILSGSEPKDKLAKKAVSWFRANRRLEDCGFETPFNVSVEGTSVLLVGRVDVKNDLEILDWKTTSRSKDELPSAASLIHTVQMPGYAKWLLDLYPRLKTVKLTHVYLSKDFEPFEVSKEFDKEVILERWQEIVEKVKAIQQIAKLDIKDVPPNLKACDAYGGCYYRDICEHGKGRTKMGMLEGLKKAEKLETVTEFKPGPTELGQAAIDSVLPPDVPEAALRKRGRPKKVIEDVPQEEKTYFSGKVTKVTLGRTVNLGEYESVRIDLEYQVEQGDHKAAFDYLKHEMKALEKMFKED